MCVVYIAMDVLLCTASIWHMCTMSVDRYFTIRYPMKFGRNRTRTMMALKIAFVWALSLAICAPIVVMGFLDYDTVFDRERRICAPQNPVFVIVGSLLAFYIPLVIMVVTFVATRRRSGTTS